MIFSFLSVVKREEIISDSFHCCGVVYNDARCVRDIDRYTGYDIYNVKRESSSFIYGITQCSRLLVQRNDFHRDVTATDTSFPLVLIMHTLMQSVAEIQLIYYI